MAQLKYWVWLSAKTGISARLREELIGHFGLLESLYFAEEKELRQVAGIKPEDISLLSDKSFDDANKILEKCDRQGIKILTMQDAEYPDRLKNITAPPILLYYKGNLPAFDEEPAIAVIGMRRNTAYGLKTAERLGHDIATGGGYIVSGMALGLDAAAHVGALKAGKPTAAVLGGGVDVVYPPENRQLYEDIVARGVVISEYPPETRPFGSNFPVRNRIMSGLSLGVLVVEAGVRSGTSITVNHALEQGRDVFAVPGNIDIPESMGTNNYIKEGAKLVTDAWDVLSEYVGLYPHKIFQSEAVTRPGVAHKLTGKPVEGGRKRDSNKETGGEKAAEKPKKSLDEVIKGFTEARRKIIVSIADFPKQMDDIIELSGLTVTEVLSELTLMELDGVVVSMPGKRYRVNETIFE